MTNFQIDIANKSIRSRILMFVVLFFMWGLLTVLGFYLNDHLRFVFNLSYATSTLISITFFSSFLIISLSAGKLIKRVGYKKSILTGWLLACIGCFIFSFAVYIKNYQYFLLALFTLAAGITILQVSANLYVVLLGDSKKAGSRLLLVQAFNSLGTVVAPFFASSVLGYHTGLSSEIRKSLSLKQLLEADSIFVFYPYLYLGVLMLIFALVIFLIDIPNINTNSLEPLNKITSLRKRHVLHFPQLRLGAFAIFAYVGSEVALGNYIDTYAKDIIQFYWGGAMVGRFVGSIILINYSVRKSVVVCSVMSILLIVLSIFTQGRISVWFIVCVGLFNSILFPSLFTLGLNGLGKYSIDGSAILIMSIVGGAVISFNVLNYSYVSYQIAFIIPILCYCYIGVYGYKLSKFEVKEEFKDHHD